MFRRSSRFLFTVSFAVLFSSAIFGADFNVTTPAEFQTALTTAQSNGETDTINVAAGTYNIASPLTFTTTENFALTITGAGSATTILDGGSSIQIMRITHNGTGNTTISGLTFQHGRVSSLEEFGAGVFVNSAGEGSITVNSCIATNNTAIRNTAGVWLGTSNGNITVTNSTFTHNECDDGTSDDGAGLYLYFDGASATGNAIVRNNNISNNTLNTNQSPVGNCDGAGMMIYHLGTSGAAPTITVEDNTINNNLTYEGASGASFHILHQQAIFIMTGNTFSGNVAGPVPSGVPIQIFGGGAHVYLDGGDVTITNNQFLDNRNIDPYGEGAGLCLDNLPTGTILVSGNIFAGNQCSGLGGGALINPGEGVTSAVICGNLFVNNEAGDTEGSGGGLSISAGCDVTMANNTFYGNSASTGAGLGYYSETAGVHLNVSNEIYRNNTTDTISNMGTGTVAATYSNIEGASAETWFGTGCIDSDPLFSSAASPAGADGIYGTEDDGLHLSIGSPSANTGSSVAVPATLTTDLTGAERIQDASVDMGAYEGPAGSGTRLTLSLDPSTISENGGESTATVTRPGDTTNALTVNITSSDDTIATVPASVEIGAGNATATFTVTGVDNAAASGTQTVTIEVSAVDHDNGSATLSVTDDESLTLSISPSTISEDAGTATGTVSLSIARVADVTVTLTSSDTAAATVPANVVITAGDTEAAFTVTGVDDTVATGDRTATITASSTGFADGTASVTLTDNDTLNFTVTLGSLYEVSATDLGDDAEGTAFSGTTFLRKPKIFGLYYDPIKDPDELRLKNAATKVTFDRSSENVTEVTCEWKKKICLYDKKNINKSQTAEVYLPLVQTNTLLMEHWGSVNDADGNRGPFEIGTVTLTVPAITAVYDSTGTTEITSATAGATIVIVGNYFGVKPPKVWLEYPVERSSGTQIKGKTCRVIKPLTYANAKGTAGRSCMDLTSNTGLSRITVQLPTRWPNGWQAGEHNIVIDNKIGRATIDFETEEE